VKVIDLSCPSNAPAQPAYGTTEGTKPARSCGDQPNAQSMFYSVVLPALVALHFQFGFIFHGCSR
jgi:hypothetical protein